MVRFLYIREGESLDKLKDVVIATGDQRLIDTFIRLVADRLGVKSPTPLRPVGSGPDEPEHRS